MGVSALIFASSLFRKGCDPLVDYDTMKRDSTQAPDIDPARFLSDLDSRGKERDWSGKKMRNELLAEAYECINPKKSARLLDCGKVLTYKVFEDGTKKLDSMSSCRVRLCPICTWRRSLKVFGQTKRIVDKIATDYGYRYLMLTLTVRSCSGSELSSTLDMILQGWNRLLQLKEIKSMCKGWYRSLEIVHDCAPFITRDMWYGNPERHVKSRKEYYKARGLKIGDENPLYDMYHPHIHALIAVQPSYFTSRYYLKQARFAELWGQSLRVDYLPRVDVRCVKGETMEDLSKAVAEVAKYAAKDTDYIVDDWELTCDTVRILDAALDSRRLVAYGGIMRQVKAALKLDDVESSSADLVHVDDDEADKEGTYRLVSYWWYSGYRQYLSNY